MLGDTVNIGQPPGELGGAADDGGDRREHLRRGEGPVRLPQPRQRDPEGQGEGGGGLRGDGPAARGGGRPRATPPPGAPSENGAGRQAARPDPLLAPAAPLRRRRGPAVATSIRLVSKSREILELDQKAMQLDKARSLSEQVANYVRGLQSQITAIARTLEVEPGTFPDARRPHPPGQRARALRGRDLPLNYISVVDTTGAGARSGIQIPEPAIEQLLQEGLHPRHPGQADDEPPRDLGLAAGAGHGALGAGAAGLPGGPPKTPRSRARCWSLASLGPLWNMTREMGQGGLFEVYIVDGARPADRPLRPQARWRATSTSPP